MKRRTMAGLLVSVTALAGCATAVPNVGPEPTAGGSWESITAYVLGPSPDGTHEVVLCEDGAAESLPPNCVGTPISNWDWETVPHETIGENPPVRFGYYDLEFRRSLDGSVHVDMDSVQESRD
ncbi:hypothetical protein [Microbacterium gilvum]|uniref:Lipoprotein n=1 Tax=Microbacterium gilvum TaxID=1336204 RepID=A0ABP8ZU80_9MICO